MRGRVKLGENFPPDIAWLDRPGHSLAGDVHIAWLGTGAPSGRALSSGRIALPGSETTILHPSGRVRSSGRIRAFSS